MANILDAFLLTSRWFDEPGTEHSTLEFWWQTPQGPVRQRLPERAICFVAQDDCPRLESMLKRLGWPVTMKALDLRSMGGASVAGCYMPGGYLGRWRQLLAEQGIRCFESDIRMTDRYLMERFVYGAARLGWSSDEQAPVVGNGFLEAGLSRMAPGSWRPDLRWLSLDIETSIPKAGETFRLYSVGLVTARERWVLLVDEHGAATGAVTALMRLATEADVLLKLNELLARFDPDVIIGWNLIQFDIDVLQQKYAQHRIPMCWGRDGSELYWRQRRDQPDRIQVQMSGRLALDGIELLRAASYRFESFALDEVARQLLGDGKLLSGAQRGHDIERLYHQDIGALVAYNLQDCDLVWRIFEKTALLAFAIERSCMTGLALDRAGGSVAAFENLYLPRLHRAGRIAPNMGDGYMATKSPGGYVMDSRPGLFEHVLVLDFKSLYPSIIRTFCIDPLGLVAGLAMEEDGQTGPASQTVPGFFGGRFHKHLHILPDLIRQLGEQRQRARKAGNEPLAQAIKIIMASCYGVLGSEGCRFHDTRLSSSITKRGHQIIQESSDWIRQQGFDVIYGDTDSVFVWLNREISAADADLLGQQLAEGLTRWWQRRLPQEFGIDSFLEMEYETHYRRFFMPFIRGADTGSKKRYAGLACDAQGAEHLVFKGLEAVRSDWTPLARDFQQELFRRLFADLPWQDWVREQVQQLLQGLHDERLWYRKRLRRPLADYQQQIPPHARAAARLDDWLAAQGLPRRFRQRGGWIQYRIGQYGPEPVDETALTQEPYPLSAPDYSHYLERQLLPILEAICHVTGDNASALLGQQASLF